MSSTFPLPEALRRAWNELRTERVRARDAAARLGVSEAALVASGCGDGNTRLTGDVRSILARVPELGTVMALTRNASCVHEKDGLYQGLSIDGAVGLALGPDIDLRLFFAHWRHAFAVSEAGRRSLQFFDAAGEAVHKIYLRPASDRTAFANLVFDFADTHQAPHLVTAEPVARACEAADAQIDVQGLRRAWDTLEDTHHFHALLRKFGVTRMQAMRLAGAEHTTAVPNQSVSALLNDAAREGVPIMVFVGNRGCIQIHTGPIAAVSTMGAWLNVMDPGFNLHLRTDAIARSWVVRKPTHDGAVSSLELYDADGATIAQIFGERKPGQAEREDWRRLLERSIAVATA